MKSNEALLNELTDAFLRWPLPESVCADGCTTIHGYKNRIGTNLLTAVEAHQMFKEVVLPLLSAPSVAPQKDAGDDMTTAASVTITAPVVECLPASEGREFLQDAIRELDKSGRVTRDYIERAEAFLSALGGDMSNESEPLRLSIEKVKAALPVAPTTDKKE